MDIFALLIGFVLVAASGVMVGLPLVRSAGNSGDMHLDYDSSGVEDSLEKQKEGIFTTLNEIEFDYNTKKLSEDDYKSLQQKYSEQAIDVLKREEALQGAQSKPVDRESLEAQIEAQLEQEVATLLQKSKS